MVNDKNEDCFRIHKEEMSEKPPGLHCCSWSAILFPWRKNRPRRDRPFSFVFTRGQMWSKGQGVQRERKTLGTTGGRGRSKTGAQPLNFRLSWRTWPKPPLCLGVLSAAGMADLLISRGKQWKQSPSLGNVIHLSLGWIHPSTPARSHTRGHIPGDGDWLGHGHGSVGPGGKEGRAGGAGGAAADSPWGLMWGPGTQQAGKASVADRVRQAVNALRALMLFSPSSSLGF